MWSVEECEIGTRSNNSEIVTQIGRVEDRVLTAKFAGFVHPKSPSSDFLFTLKNKVSLFRCVSCKKRIHQKRNLSYASGVWLPLFHFCWQYSVVHLSRRKLFPGGSLNFVNLQLFPIFR